MLGYGLSIIVDTLNPERIVIGSVYARCQDLLEKPMLKVMKRECIDVSLSVCKVVPAALSENIGDVAALAVATECIK
jgi:glucokinase